jgi:RNA polymerase-binding transcription factor DksA
MPGGRARAGVPEADAVALRSALVEHRRARADQIEALLLLAEGGADAVDRREFVVARAVLADIDAALSRLDDGTYGWCVRCADAIGLPRLQVAPRTRFCIDCALER